MVDVTTTTPGFSATIDGSITSLITGVISAAQEAVASATGVTRFGLDPGDLATTALGA